MYLSWDITSVFKLLCCQLLLYAWFCVVVIILGMQLTLEQAETQASISMSVTCTLFAFNKIKLDRKLCNEGFSIILTDSY